VKEQKIDEQLKGEDDLKKEIVDQWTNKIHDIDPETNVLIIK
jgi:cell division protein FtsL